MCRWRLRTTPIIVYSVARYRSYLGKMKFSRAPPINFLYASLLSPFLLGHPEMNRHTSNWLNLMKPSLPILNPYLREFSDPPSRETQQYHSSNSMKTQPTPSNEVPAPPGFYTQSFMPRRGIFRVKPGDLNLLSVVEGNLLKSRLTYVILTSLHLFKALNISCFLICSNKQPASANFFDFSEINRFSYHGHVFLLF